MDVIRIEIHLQITVKLAIDAGKSKKRKTKEED